MPVAESNRNIVYIVYIDRSFHYAMSMAGIRGPVPKQGSHLSTVQPG